MENKDGIKEVLDSGLTSKERIFPILNKIDRIWTANDKVPFCDLIKELFKEVPKNDLELTITLDDYIEKYNIK